MARIEIGKAYCFTPYNFSAQEKGSLGGRPIKVTLDGTIISINRPHHIFTVEAEVNGYKLRESFHF